MKLVTWLSWMLLLLLSSQNGIFHIRLCQGSSQAAEHFYNFIMSRSTHNLLHSEDWPELEQVAGAISSSPSSANIEAQEGLMEADKIDSLPGQPPGVKFNHYSGYVTVDRKAGRSLFYYFAESPHNSSTNPLVLWFSGGPGCSSLGGGSMQEMGPFKVNPDGKTLYLNDYSWTNVANMLFLESPAGVGFSYSNTTSDYQTVGDKRTAKDAYTFLINWLERFPHYKNRDFYITGESYGGHYVPQLAYTVLAHNRNSNNNQSFINLKGIVIGNPLLDALITYKSIFENLWTHAVVSDETYSVISKECDYVHGNLSKTCQLYQAKAFLEMGLVPLSAIYTSYCSPNVPTRTQSSGSGFDPCSANYVKSYLNQEKVQKAIHAINTSWTECSLTVGAAHWKDAPVTTVPIIKKLIANQIKVWIYSGDIDGLVPVTSTKYAIKTMKLPVEVPWHAWYSKGGTDVGGYVQAYKGLTFVTIRGAGHSAPSYQPERAFIMFSSFLQGKLPPSLSSKGTQQYI